MKGTVFVELLKMAEDAFGEDVVDHVLDNTELANDGVYTAVGNYPCSELVKIVEAFSEHSGISPNVLQVKFGHWMLEHFAEHYSEFFKGKTGSFEMLEAIDQEIHLEVKKLYPDAELPRFETKRMADNHLSMRYSSPRPLVGFCHGLIEACVLRFDEKASISRCPIEHDKTSTKFDITLEK